MVPPPRYSVAPFYSFVTVPAHRAPSFSETLGQIVAWWLGRSPTLKQQIVDAQRVERLAQELADADDRRAERSGVYKARGKGRDGSAAT